MIAVKGRYDGMTVTLDKPPAIRECDVIVTFLDTADPQPSPKGVASTMRGSPLDPQPSPKGEGSPLDPQPSPKGEGSPLDPQPSPKGEGSPLDDGSLEHLFRDYKDDGIREPIVDFGKAVGNEQW